MLVNALVSRRFQLLEIAKRCKNFVNDCVVSLYCGVVAMDYSTRSVAIVGLLLYMYCAVAVKPDSIVFTFFL